MVICEWFDNNVIKLKEKISNTNNFNNINTDKKYSNIITDLKISNNNFNFNMPINLFNEETLIATHKYKINFNNNQQQILLQYLNECNKLYNLCIDIWNDYKDMTSNYFIVKDVIFKYFYRNKYDNIDNVKKNIINELKEKQDIFNITKQENQEKINELKLINKNKYKEEMIEYNKLKKINEKSTIKNILIKPRIKKIMINKIKNPPKERGKNILKPAPDETLKYEIKDFCKNLDNARKQAVENNKYNKETKKINDDAFILKYKNISLTQTIAISKRNISKKGIFINKLKNIECNNYKKIIEKYEIENDCLLQYNFRLKIFYFLIVFKDKYKDEEKLKNRYEITSIDQGEKIFMYFYSNNLQGKMGDNMRIKILKIQRKIKKIQKLIDKKINKNGKKIKNKSKLRKKIILLYREIKNYVNNMHKQCAKFLCENYKNIFLPEFKTKPMISKNKINIEINKIKEIKDKLKAKNNLNILTKKIKLSNNVKFVLSMQGHYRFKEYLKQYAKKYKTYIYDVNEAYTSQCCSYCGFLSKQYDKNRLKSCINCKNTIDRDENGAKNILLKCLNAMPNKMLD